MFPFVVLVLDLKSRRACGLSLNDLRRSIWFCFGVVTMISINRDELQKVEVTP